MTRLGAVVVLLAGCGRLGFDRLAVDPDATGPIDTPPDEAADAPPPTGPFGTAIAIPSLGAGDDPSLRADLLEIFFDSGRTGGMGGGDIWTATRSDAADSWDMATNVGALNTGGDDATPELSRDGRTLYWVANGSGGMKDIYYATRATPGAAWSTPVHIVDLASAFDESGPTLTPDELTMYFSRNETTDDDLYVSTRATKTSAWSAADPLALSSPTAQDGEPFINGANTLLLFSSDRGGDRDLWLVRRATPADPWGTPEPVVELNTNADEGDPWLSPDERVIVFSRGTTMYMATR